MHTTIRNDGNYLMVLPTLGPFGASVPPGGEVELDWPEGEAPPPPLVVVRHELVEADPEDLAAEVAAEVAADDAEDVAVAGDGEAPATATTTPEKPARRRKPKE